MFRSPTISIEIRVVIGRWTPPVVPMEPRCSADSIHTALSEPILGYRLQGTMVPLAAPQSVHRTTPQPQAVEPPGVALRQHTSFASTSIAEPPSSQTSLAGLPSTQEFPNAPTPQPLNPTSESFSGVKEILRGFLYGECSLPSPSLSEAELSFLKSFLKKKIMRTQRKSSLRLIDSMDPLNFSEFLRLVILRRRKSVVKGVIFRLFWKFASQKRNLLSFFSNDPSYGYQLNKVNNNLQDEYYKRCLGHADFRRFFFEVLRSNDFFEFCIAKSRLKFDRKFDQWVAVMRKSSQLNSLMTNIQIPLTKAEVEKSSLVFADLVE